MITVYFPNVILYRNVKVYEKMEICFPLLCCHCLLCLLVVKEKVKLFDVHFMSLQKRHDCDTDQ